jgi:hypothetical protein
MEDHRAYYDHPAGKRRADCEDMPGLGASSAGMARRIQCRDHKSELTRQDRLNGWKMRRVYLCLNQPEIFCDVCGSSLPPGTIAVAHTMWQGSHAEIREWEEEFGTVLPIESVLLSDKLSGE